MTFELRGEHEEQQRLPWKVISLAFDWHVVVVVVFAEEEEEQETVEMDTLAVVVVVVEKVEQQVELVVVFESVIYPIIFLHYMTIYLVV